MSTITETIPQTSSPPAAPAAPPPPPSAPPTPVEKAKQTVKFEQRRGETRGWRRRDGGGKWSK